MRNVINPIIVELGLFTSELIVRGNIGDQVTILKENDIIYDETISTSNPSPIRLEVKGNFNYTVKINKSGQVTTETIFIPLNHEQFLEYYKVFFDLNGGLVVSGEADQRIAIHGDGIPPICEKKGYVSYTWNGDYTDVTSNRVIQAIWTNTYNVTFIFDGGHDANGEEEVTYSVIPGDTSQTPPQPYTALDISKEFDRWDGDYTNVNSNRTITAKWKTKTFKIPFNATQGKFSDGSKTMYSTVEYNDTARPPEIPTFYDSDNNQWNFAGWDTNLEKITEIIYPKAKWNVEIRFDARVGEFPNGNRYDYDTVEYGETASIRRNPTFTDSGNNAWKFEGWNEDLNNITRKIDPWAVWTIEIKFDACGGKFSNGREYAYDTVEYDKAASVTNPSRDGYDFTGWDENIKNITQKISPCARWSAWNGWYLDGKPNYKYGNKYYENGYYKTGWFSVDSFYYYGGSDGICYTGWHHNLDNGSGIKGTFYFHLTGRNMVTYWQKIDGYWYYFGGSGMKRVGLLDIKNTDPKYSKSTYKYYLLESEKDLEAGRMQLKWVKYGGYWYYFEPSDKAKRPLGAAFTDGTYTIDGINYRFDASGKCLNP